MKHVILYLLIMLCLLTVGISIKPVSAHVYAETTENGVGIDFNNIDSSSVADDDTESIKEGFAAVCRILTFICAVVFGIILLFVMTMILIAVVRFGTSGGSAMERKKGLSQLTISLIALAGMGALTLLFGMLYMTFR